MASRFLIDGVDGRTPLREAAPAILRAKAAPVFALEQAAREGGDADAVHDMRVASRRTREAMRLLAPAYESAEFARLFRRIRRVTRALGPVRDADVFIAAMAGLAPGLPADGRSVAMLAVGYRGALRERELRRLVRALDRIDLRSQRTRFDQLLENPLGGSIAGVPLAELAAAAIASRLEVVAATQADALASGAPAQLHALRIAYKRLRYAAEVFAPVYGERFEPLHEVLTAYQNRLGELHDAHVFAEALRDPGLRALAYQAGAAEQGFAELEAALQAQADAALHEVRQLAEAHAVGELAEQLAVED